MATTAASELVVIQGSASRALPVLTAGEREGLGARPAEGYGHLPIELLRTERNCYVFDAHRVCFLPVEPVAFDLLAILRERPVSLDELIARLPQHPAGEVRSAHRALLEAQAEGFLVPYRFERAARHTNDEYREVLSRRMGGFTIFITTRCNLGCSYCIYGGQYNQHAELSQTPMPWETLQATMDFLARHSPESPQVRLDFFGGEPLLAFPTLARSVRYLKSLLPAGKPQVVVTITSNGTILTDAILDFLLEHDVYLQFSIDGGRASHDRARPFKGTDRGSYDLILRNLQKIYDRDPRYFQTHMRLKGVLTTEGVEEDDTEFFAHPLVGLIAAEGHFIYLNLEPHYDLAKDTDYFERLDRLGRRLLAVRGAETEADLLGSLNPKQRALYHHTFGLFFDAQAIQEVYFAGSAAVPFAKGCLTGFQEGAVSPNGDISICLKSAKGDNFVIGNVLEGRWYFEKIQQLNALFHHDWAGCSSCFVQRFCELCYEKLNGEVGQWASGRRKFCDFNRQRYRTIFHYMLRVLEENPALWKHVDHVIDLKLQRERASAGDDAARYSSRSLYSSPE